MMSNLQMKCWIKGIATEGRSIKIQKKKKEKIEPLVNHRPVEEIPYAEHGVLRRVVDLGEVRRALPPHFRSTSLYSASVLG
jgi:hypothetical protein